MVWTGFVMVWRVLDCWGMSDLRFSGMRVDEEPEMRSVEPVRCQCAIERFFCATSTRALVFILPSS